MKPLAIGSHVEHTEIKGNAVCAFMILLFFFYLPITFADHMMLFMMFTWMHDHIYHMDWPIKGILRLSCSVYFSVMCLTTFVSAGLLICPSFH